MLSDGIYGLRFDADSGTGGAFGEGLAVLRRGRIVGSDAFGGVFAGRCLYDPAHDETVVTVRVAVPPHGILLTGFEAGSRGAVVEVSGRFQSPCPVSSAVVDVGGAPVAVELRYVGALIV